MTIPALFRRYTLTRLAKGDYLLLSNSGRTLWRVSTYTEDGSACTGDGRAITGKFWGVWRYTRALRSRCLVDPDDWNDFDMYEHMIRTRREAITVALALSTNDDSSFQIPVTKIVTHD
jgi:hypothetical protein